MKIFLPGLWAVILNVTQTRIETSARWLKSLPARTQLEQRRKTLGHRRFSKGESDSLFAQGFAGKPPPWEEMMGNDQAVF